MLTVYLQKSTSVQPRTSLKKFGGDSITNTKVLIKYIHFIYSFASFLRIVFLNVRVSTNLWGSAGQVWQAARFDYDKFEWQTPFKSWNVSSLIHSSLIHYPQKRAMQLMLATSIAPLLAVGRVPLPEDARFWAESSSEKKALKTRDYEKKKPHRNLVLPTGMDSWLNSRLDGQLYN